MLGLQTKQAGYTVLNDSVSLFLSGKLRQEKLPLRQDIFSPYSIARFPPAPE